MLWFCMSKAEIHFCIPNHNLQYNIQNYNEVLYQMPPPSRYSIPPLHLQTPLIPSSYPYWIRINICNADQLHDIIIPAINISPMPLQHYELLSKIGSGKYASVYRIKRIADGKFFAMKKILINRMTPKEKANSLSEVRLLSAIAHPNIVSLVDVFYDEFIESLCLVEELAEGGDLSKWIATKNQRNEVFSEEEIWSIVAQISKGLEFMHSHNVIHRDIKASNILLYPGGVVKIGDLNISKINDGLFYTRTGTFTYASPEIWKGERYDCKSDIWSFGCLIYQLICLRKPFEGENIQEIFRKICKCQYPKIANETCSRELKDVVTFMIQINPKLRPSAATLCKFYSSKRTKVQDCRQIGSFNLASLSIPGLELTPQSSQSRLLQPSSAECNLVRMPSKSRNRQYLSPIPSTLKAIKRCPDLQHKQTKSRYNCKNIGRISLHSEEPSYISNQPTSKPSSKNESNAIFKRSTKPGKLKVLRRNTQN